jgi:hypothetical protein
MNPRKLWSAEIIDRRRQQYDPPLRVAWREGNFIRHIGLGTMLNKKPRKIGSYGRDVGMAWNATMA